MPAGVFGLRDDFEIVWVVVVLVLVDVMDDLMREQLATKFLLCNNAVLVPAMEFPVRSLLDPLDASELGETIVRATLLFRRQIMRITVALHAHVVLAAHALRAMDTDLLAAHGAWLGPLRSFFKVSHV